MKAEAAVDRRSALASCAAKAGYEVLTWVKGRGVRVEGGMVVRRVTWRIDKGVECFTARATSE